MEPRIAHWLKSNEQTRIPRRHVIIDTEARTRPVKGGHEQRWRLGAGAFLVSDPRRGWTHSRGADFDTPEQLWTEVVAHCRPGRRTVLWAHNLAYDLRISHAFSQLARRGFRLDWIALDAQAVTAHWSSEHGSLVMADLYSWLPVALDRIASELDMPARPDMPADDDEQGWRDRCRRDVATTARAVQWLLGWIERGDFGCWQTTGAGQSHAAFRHRFMTHKLLVHDDIEALDAERRATWTGRCEVWRHGDYPGVRLHEYDLHAAYAQICADVEVPTRLLGEINGGLERNRRRIISERCVLAEVAVDTRHPIVPTEADGRIYWPVGRFTTTLWTPELQVLLAAGARVEIRRAWLYDRAPALQAWAQWALGRLDPATPNVPALERLIVKHWSRALIGRLALRYRRWDLLSERAPAGLELDTLIDSRTSRTSELLHVGRDLLALAEMTESPSSLPQITGYVMSVCRARLWTLMGVCGHEHLYYVDTDSLITDDEGHRRLALHIRQTGAWGLRRKASYRGGELRGPRNITLGEENRIAGVPRAAYSPAAGVYDAQVWQSLPTALRTGRPDRVLIYDRRYHVQPRDRRRRHRRDGSTVAYRLGGPSETPGTGTPTPRSATSAG